MPGFLRQSTVATIKLGQFVSPTDGCTVYTAGGFTVKVATNGGSLAARHDATAIVHDADGYYAVELDATDTATVGRLKIEVPGSVGNYLPAEDCFSVLSAAVYDFLFGTTAPLTDKAGFALAASQAFNNTGQTSNLPADVQTIKTQAVTAAGAVTFPGSIGTSTFAAGGNVNASSIGGQVVTASTGITFAATVGTSTYAGGDTTGTTTLLSRLPSALTIAAGKVAATVGAGDSADAASVKTTIGVAGAGLTAIGDTRLANLDATVSSRSTFATGGTVGSVTGSVGSVTAAVTLPATLPAGSINTAAFAAGATLPRVTLADTVTTYTGNTPQTGDAFARLGAPTGVSIAADIQTRSTYAGGAVASVTGSVGSVTDRTGFSLAASGLDAIMIETGVNARQALSPILAMAGGVVAGAVPGTASTVTIKGGNTATTRISAQCDGSGNRTSVTLTLPS